MSEPCTPSKRHSVIITIVHGTWGGRRGWRKKIPLWFEPNSEFRQELCKALYGMEVTIEVLAWSGSNSVVARYKAAVNLARQISTNLNLYPDHRHLVIAHSHGGNIALKAMDIAGSQAFQVRLVTVATPFLQIHSNALFARFRLASLAIYIPPATFCLVYAGYFAYLCSLGPIPPLPTDFFFVNLMVSLGLLIAFGIPAARHARGLIRDLRSKTDRNDYINKLVRLTNYKVNRGHYILVLRGVYDEASIALGVGALTAAVSQFISRYLPLMALLNFAYQLVITSFAVMVGSEWVHPRDPNRFTEGPGDDPVVFAISVLSVPVLISCVLIGIKLVAACGRLVFGREMIFSSERLEMDISNVPDSSESLTVATLEPNVTPKGLRHGLYTHPFFHVTVRDWFVSKMAERSSTSRAGY
jgi:hypothetical protein